MYISTIPLSPYVAAVGAGCALSAGARLLETFRALGNLLDAFRSLTDGDCAGVEVSDPAGPRAILAALPPLLEGFRLLKLPSEKMRSACWAGRWISRAPFVECGIWTEMERLDGTSRGAVGREYESTGLSNLVFGRMFRMWMPDRSGSVL